jgi:hypothetical protein
VVPEREVKKAGNVANEIKGLVDRINNAIRDEKFKRIALTTTLAIQKQRIYVQGLDSKGSQIGTYSKKPASISKKNQARNTGKTYFPGGYSEYHAAIGKGGDKVVLRNTDQEMMDYGLIQNGQEFGFGFQNSLNAEKAGWHVDKYKKEIHALTDKEIELTVDTYLAQLNKAI